MGITDWDVDSFISGILEPAVSKGMDAAAESFVTTIKGAAPSRTGRLRNSISFSRENITKRSIGSPLSYANTIEKGGIIRGRNGRYLLIPLTSEAERMTNVRAVKGLFTVMSKAGNLLLCRTKGKNQLEPLFVLKRQVNRRAKPFLAPSLQRGASAAVAKFVAAAKF